MAKEKEELVKTGIPGLDKILGFIHVETPYLFGGLPH